MRLTPTQRHILAVLQGGGSLKRTALYYLRDTDDALVKTFAGDCPEVGELRVLGLTEATGAEREVGEVFAEVFELTEAGREAVSE
jgi:hypothetical protein